MLLVAIVPANERKNVADKGPGTGAHTASRNKGASDPAESERSLAIVARREIIPLEQG